MNRYSRHLANQYAAVTGNIFKFCDAMNFTPTWQQRELLQAVQDAADYNARGQPREADGKGSNWIACKSGQGPGKTTASCIIGGWRSLQFDALSCSGAKTIVTAPTMAQCRDVWLSEFRSMLRKADAWLRNVINVTLSKVEIGGDPDWGVKLVTSTKQENAQGRHNPKLTVIVEEASGVSMSIIEQYVGTLSNPDALLVLIGNPNTRDCEFFQAFEGPNQKRWKHLTFNAEDTARDYPHIVNPQRNQDLADRYGRDSDVYRIRVLGLFPGTEPNAVISAMDLERCQNPLLLLPCARMERPTGGIARQLGVDLARFGGDDSAIYRRHGNAIVESFRGVRLDPSVVVDKAIQMQTMADWSDDQTFYIVDAGGMGQGVMHRFYQAGKNVMEFHNNGSPTDVQFVNKITEAWFNLAKMLRQTRCYIPYDFILNKQLTTRRYKTDKDGKLLLESKDDYIKRGFESPDKADAIVLTFYEDVYADGRHAVRNTVEEPKWMRGRR